MGSAGFAAQGLGYRPQALVARLMAVVVVVAFEEIDVDHQDRQRQGFAPAVTPLGRQCLVKAAAVGDARQAVAERHGLQGVTLGLQLLVQFFQDVVLVAQNALICPL